MCRNIRTLHHFEPPTTPEEIRAAALQYVRKVSGMTKPVRDADAVFARAVDQVAAATTRLLDALPLRAEARTREGEQAKARARWERRAQSRTADTPSSPDVGRGGSVSMTSRGERARRRSGATRKRSARR
jgi:hypothetical protein